MIQLLREPIDKKARRVMAMPEWIGPARKTDGYWHIPRSAARYDNRISVHTWCGQLINTEGRTLTDQRPPDMVCGTCVGRHRGAGRVDGQVFSPRDHFGLPTRCPGESDGRHCVACGARVRYSWMTGTTIHRPAPELLERCSPCPAHGWKDMISRADRLVCIAWSSDGDCGWEAGP